MNGHPLELALPDGIRAVYVPGSRPPQYEVEGKPLDLDVMIPADLIAAGWHWHGTYLSNGDALIATSACDTLGDCFAAAREYGAAIDLAQTLRTDTPLKRFQKVRRQKAAAPPAEPELEQAVLF